MNVRHILRTARLVSWGYRLLSTAVGLVTVRLINDRVGMPGYGEIAFTLAILTGVSAIDLGFLQALPRFVARHGQDDPLHRGQFWAVCALAAGALFALQLVLVIGLAIALGFSAQLHSISVNELLALGVIMVGAGMLTAASSIYAGWQQYGLAGMAKIGRSLAYLVAVVLLWANDDLSVRSVLWANAWSALVPNMLVAATLLGRSRKKLAWSWQGYPLAHRARLHDLASYSLRGWLFTAANTLVASGSVVVAGLAFPPPMVGKLQLALVLYTGVAAFVTGAMVPLMTIRARNSDASAVSVQRVAQTARSLVEETIVLTAALLVFFAHHSATVIGMLLGEQAGDPALMAATKLVILTALLPGLAILPWFTFRFALVDVDENKRYCRQVFFGTLLALGVGSAAAVLAQSPLAMAAGIGAALVYRGALAYWLGHGVLPGLTPLRMLAPMVAAVLLCDLTSRLCQLAAPGWRVREFGDTHLQAALYLGVCAVLYVFRGRLHWLWGLRLPSSERGPDL